MDRQRFLRELEEIKAGLESRNNQSVCNRIYTALVDCLAAESKSVEAKLQVLTAALSYYTDLRPSHDAVAAEADALGHYLFMECSRVVLGIEFHHLANDDPYKVALKETIVAARQQLASYTICHVFHILDWLLVNQWSHPTLVAMMRGEDVDRECALAYVTTGEYPELLRLRIQMLMESGCEGYSLNLISWCVRSPVFESDIAMRATYLLLLHRLGRTDDFHNQCCQIRCCVACDLLRHLSSRGSVEDQSFLLLLSQTFLLVNWVKPVQACCIQELLEFWLRIQRGNEPDMLRFQDSIRKVAVLTQHLKHMSILLDVLVSEFGEEILSLCTELCVSVFRRELSRICQHGAVAHQLHNPSCRHFNDLDPDVSASLAQICRALSRLYDRHPQMRLASMLTAFSLLPSDTQFYDIEDFCHMLPSPVSDKPVLSADVDHQLYTSLLELLSCLRLPELDSHIGWDSGLKLAAVRRLEETGLRYDVMMNSFITADKKLDVRLGRSARVPVRASAVLPAGDDAQGGKRELNRSTVTPNAGGFTLDDIQQVLSAANCPVPSIMSQSVTCGVASSTDTSVDERALKEITAFLQSEIGSNKVPHDVSSRGAESLCGYNAASSVASHDSGGLLVRLIPPAGAAESRVSSESHNDSRPPQPAATDAGGTILVTDSNLPYLQQFLPNLQTVMQSVQSLVRCVPQSAASGPDISINTVASNPQQRSMSLPSLATSKNPDAQLDSGTSHKKRKRSGHSTQSKLDNIASAANVNSFTLAVKDFPPSKSSDSVQTKMEPDSATSTAEGGFTCGLCSRTFSKRLGLSVHIQRAHGHRRSSESVELSHDGFQFPDKAVQRGDAVNVKNCFVKTPVGRVDGCPAVGDMPSSSVCMCDGCGEIVSGLEAHAAVCAGRQSPVKLVSDDVVMEADKCDSVPAVSTNTAVVEMLQLAEHFLRQHVPTASGSDQAADQLHLLSPPPYSEENTRLSNMITVSVGCSRLTANGPAVIPAEMPTGAVVPSQPPGKEIVYEGSRMREFVEYQCEACLLTFSSSALANSHLSDHHTSASLSAYRVYACLSCSLRYRDPRIMRHHVVYLCGGSRPQTDGAQSKQQQQLFPCSFCPKTFMSTDYMQLHVRLRHSGPQPATSAAQPPVQCVLPAPPGATSVPSLEQLVSHFRRHPAAANQATVTNAISTAGQESSAKQRKLRGSCTPVRHELMMEVASCKPQAVVDGRQLNTTPDSAKSRSSKAKGILYKNVFMQCEGTYYCSVCHADLTGRESKRRHRQLQCGDPKTASYSRRYSYVCPYCSERFPSQKLCRQHQIDECLPLMGVGTAELGISEHRCPLCPKTCFGFPALKGHIMQAHHMPKEEASKLLAEHGLAVATCGALAVDNSQEFNGVLSPAISSPSSTLSTTTSAFVTQTRPSPAACSLYDGTVNVSRGDGLESDDDIPEPEQPKELFPQLYESVVGDDGQQPSEDISRPKRNRKSRANEFFVMMFRNYPILAKGVSMCRSCAAQLEASVTTESHAGSCTGSSPADVRRSTLFRCTHCTSTFWRAKDCRTHQLESCLPAHGVKIERLTEPSVACPMCDVRSYNRSGLMSHMKFRHSLDTDGVRQVMDRCGIRKSVPPAADNIILTTSPEQEYEDGSLSMDAVGVQCSMACDGVMAMPCVETTQSPNATAADVLVDGVSELPTVTNDDTANDSVNTWRTANMVLQRSSADVNN